MKPVVGIDCQKILDSHGQGAGIEHYIFHLASSLFQEHKDNYELKFFFHPNSDKKLLDKFSQNAVIFPKETVERQGLWPYTKYKKQAKWLESQKLDLFHGPANIAPLFYTGKIVVTIHDLISYEHPEWFPKPSLAEKFWKKKLVPNSIQKASRIIAVSNSTKQQIISHFSIDEQKIDTIYEGLTINVEIQEESNILQKHKITEPYLLYIGTLEPRKNIVRMIEAFSKISAKNPSLKFVIAGKKGWKYEQIFEIVRHHNLESRIIFPGYITEADKYTLHKHALAFIWTSLAEGFGLPILDAMRLGLPVLTSNCSSMREITGEAALKANPLAVDEIAEGMRKLVADENLRSELAEKGLKQAEKFSWEKSARQTINTYQKAFDAK